MTITHYQAKTLLDKLKKDGYPGPFHFQPWGEQNQNGDYAESILFDANGETLVYGLPDAVGNLAAAAPELAQTVIFQAERIAVLIELLNNSDIYPTAKEAPNA